MKAKNNVTVQDQDGNSSKPLLPAVSLRKKRAKCYNCKHSGTTFIIAKVTHQHCEHPKYTREMFESGELSPWDTLCTFSDTCKDHEFRSPK